MLDTSQIVARGYAIVQKNQGYRISAGIEEKMSYCLCGMGAGSRGETLSKKRN